ncbi:MAG: FG-GAP repeat domain-containing protein [Candidatus Midichloria sp.]|uniref:VCBS repeat containing protein n=1 Tax=Hyalomma marginatum TaxID=34627 RepID=A0A8S4C041_9ACAR|nr:VCBS repeat containing protein [Hyalomma marginatum]CAG7589923.1 VCBS repeat containing protein [Hyalomma marginatum]
MSDIFELTASCSASEEPGEVVAADLNKDGKLDIVVGSDVAGKVSILLGNGDSTFKAAVSYNASYAVHGVAVADFNHDSQLDISL